MEPEFSPDLQLSGKVVIVTGAARGIGEAIARAFGYAKCKVLIADRMKRPDGRSRAQALAQQITKAGGQALVMQVDISDSAQVEKMFKAAIDRFGKVEVLVNNAGIIKGGFLYGTDDRNLRENFDVNVRGSLYCCQLAAKHMIKNGNGGKIIVMTSTDGIGVNEGEVAYSMSKAALILLTRCIAVELAPYKINVNAIAPGWVATDMTIPYVTDLLKKEIQKRVPLGEMAKPEQIAGAALFLASPLSDYITGHVLVVDGGLTINLTIKADESTSFVG